jgi:hypothetical protein
MVQTKIFCNPEQTALSANWVSFAEGGRILPQPGAEDVMSITFPRFFFQKHRFFTQCFN